MPDSTSRKGIETAFALHPLTIAVLTRTRLLEPAIAPYSSLCHMSNVATDQVLPSTVVTCKSLHSVRQVYVSDSIRCLMLIDARCRQQRWASAIALEAFNRLAIAATEPGCGDVATALYEFLTFIEARGWQPLCFEIPATLIPLWRTQDFQTMQLDSQRLAYCYRA